MSDPVTPPPPPGSLPGDSYGSSPVAPPPGGPPAGGPPAVPHRPGLPWENGKDPASLLETIKRLIASPGRAYAEMREKGDYASPLLFALVLILVGSMFGALWQMVFGGPEQFLSGMKEMPPEFAEALARSTGPGSLITTLIMGPIFGIVGLFIWSGIVHLTLSLLGGLRDSTAGFEGSFRTVSYSAVAQLAVVVPFVGSLIAFVWSVALGMIGLSTVHNTSQGKALAAVLIPFFICCCLGIGIAFAFVGAIGAALGMAGS